MRRLVARAMSPHNSGSITRGTRDRLTGMASRIPRLLAAATALLALGGLAAPARADAATRPMPVGVTDVRVTPAGPDQVRVRWRGGGDTTRYAFLAGSTSMTDMNHFQTGWISAGDPRIRSRSILLTVPTRFRAVLGAGSGNYLFVKVAQTDAVVAPAICRVWTPMSLCRASPSGSSSLAGSLHVAGPTFPLSVATWNVQSVSATQDFPTGQRWASRRAEVARTIEAAAPDVIGTQESTTARLDPACLNADGPGTEAPCPEQYMDLGAAIRDHYTTAGPDAWQWVYDQTARHSHDSAYRVYVDSAIYYRPEIVTELQHGFISPVDDLGVTALRSHDEAGIWALLQDTATRRSFLVVSMHLPVGGENSRVRLSEAAALAAWTRAKSDVLGGVPVIITADLNSFAGQDRLPAVTPLRAAGFVDAAAASQRTNPRWSSTNSSNSDRTNDGYPSAAVQHPYPTTRIDAILIRVPGSDPQTTYSDRYENVLHLLRHGTRFDGAYQGSDHDLQLADLRLPLG